MFRIAALRTALFAIGVGATMLFSSAPADAGASTGRWRNGMVAGPYGVGYYGYPARRYGAYRAYRYRPAYAYRPYRYRPAYGYRPYRYRTGYRRPAYAYRNYRYRPAYAYRPYGYRPTYRYGY
jgi:hypothetical protein